MIFASTSTHIKIVQDSVQWVMHQIVSTIKGPHASLSILRPPWLPIKPKMSKVFYDFIMNLAKDGADGGNRTRTGLLPSPSQDDLATFTTHRH